MRWVLTKGKLPTATWIDVVTTAHRVGLRSSSTMMFGHVDQPHHWLSAPTGAGEHPGRDWWVHRVRAAVVRASVGAAVPGWGGTARSDHPREPGGPCCGPVAASWSDRPHSDVLGEVGLDWLSGDASLEEPTTSAAPSWRRRSVGWPAASTAQRGRPVNWSTWRPRWIARVDSARPLTARFRLERQAVAADVRRVALRGVESEEIPGVPRRNFSIDRCRSPAADCLAQRPKTRSDLQEYRDVSSPGVTNRSLPAVKIRVTNTRQGLDFG